MILMNFDEQNSRQMRLHVEGLKQPSRLDRFLQRQFPQWGRRAVQSIISAKKVKVNGRIVWLASWKINNGDQLEVLRIPRAKTKPPTAFDESWLIAEEPDLIVVNKPAGLLSEPTRWRRGANLLDFSQQRFGPVTLFHRLDRDTSGLVLLTRRKPINRILDAAFKAGTIIKEYIAIVSASTSLDEKGTIRTRLAPHPKRRDMMTTVERGGKRAITRYQVDGSYKDTQLVRLWPETGRTHQLRVHLQALGTPILGDRLYGTGPKSAKRLMLHASQLSLPAAADFPARSYQAPIPAEFHLGRFQPATFDEE